MTLCYVCTGKWTQASNAEHRLRFVEDTITGGNRLGWSEVPVRLDYEAHQGHKCTHFSVRPFEHLRARECKAGNWRN